MSSPVASSGAVRAVGTLARGLPSLLLAVLALALTSCGAGGIAGGGGDSDQLPLQESPFVVSGDVTEDATPVRSVAVTEEQLEKIASACAAAQGIPLQEGEKCLGVMNIAGPSCRASVRYCLTVYTAPGLDAHAAGYAEVVDRRDGSSRCEPDPPQLCLRVGLTDDVVARVRATQPTSSAATPTETTPTPTETPTESPTELPTEEPTDTPPGGDDGATPPAEQVPSASPQ